MKRGKNMFCIAAVPRLRTTVYVSGVQCIIQCAAQERAENKVIIILQYIRGWGAKSNGF